MFKDTTISPSLELPPHHLVDYAHVGLDDADDFGGDVFIYIIGDGDAREAVADEGDGNVYALQEALGVDAGEDKAALVQGFRPLRASPNAHRREGMADGGEEAALFRQGTGI